jgi:hypothetical protein
MDDKVRKVRDRKVPSSLENDSPDSFFFKRNENGLEYFPASIVETYDDEGESHNDLRVFNPGKDIPDEEIDHSSLIHQMKNGNVKMLY